VSTAKQKQVLIGIVLAQVLDSTALAILLPAIPFLAIRLGAHPVTVAALLSVQFVCGALGAPVLGWLSDRIPRAAILVGSLVAVSATYWLLTIVDSIVLLFMLRCATGFVGSNLALLESMVAELTTTGDRSRGFAKLRLGSTTGLMIGPAAAALIGRLRPGDGLYQMLVLGAIVQLLPPIVIAWTLRGGWPTRPVRARVSAHDGSVLKRFVANAKIRDYALIKALIATCFALVMAISPVWSGAHLGWRATDLSILVFGFGLALFVVQVAIATDSFKWLTSSMALFVACLIVVPAFALLIVFPHGAALVLCCLALGFSSAVVNIVVPATISRIALLDVGAMLGIASTGVLAGSSLGPMAFGAIYERLGSAWTWSGGLVYALVASLLALKHVNRAADAQHASTDVFSEQR
jgi:MFS transporter, DHA1 family, tetracycline resistance protein